MGRGWSWGGGLCSGLGLGLGATRGWMTWLAWVLFIKDRWM